MFFTASLASAKLLFREIQFSQKRIAMGTRDYRWREKKKTKKDAKKAPVVSVTPPEAAVVRVIKTKGKKPSQTEEG